MHRLHFLTQYLQHPTPTGVAILVAFALVGLAGCYILSRVDLAVTVTVGLFLQLFNGNWELMHIPLPLDRLVLGAALVVLVLKGARRVCVRQIVVRPVHVAMLCALAWAVASAILAGTLYTHLGFYALLDRFGIVPFAVFTLAPLVFGTPKQRNILLIGLVTMGLYLGATGVFEGLHIWRLVFPSYISNPNVGIQWGRARGPFLESTGDGFCIFVGMVAAAIALRSWRSQWARGACYLTMVLGAAALFFTLTRSVWIGGFLGVFGAMLLTRKTRRILVPVIVVGALAVTGTLVVSSRIRSETIGRTESQSPVWDRENTDLAALKILSEKPLTGVGWENFINVSTEYMRQQPKYPITGVGLEVHNVFLNVAANLGIPGLLLFLLALGGAIWRALSPIPWPWAGRRSTPPRAPPDGSLADGSLAHGSVAHESWTDRSRTDRSWTDRSRAEDWSWRDPWRIGTVAILLFYMVIANLVPFSEALPNTLLWVWLGVVAMPYTSQLRVRAAVRKHSTRVVGWSRGREVAPVPAYAHGRLDTALVEPMYTAGAPGPGTPLQVAAPVPGSVAGTTETGQRPPGLRGIARGFSLGITSQLIGVAGNLVLTPFVIHGLGIQRYGVFILVVTATGMLTSFDGGVLGAAQRYFAVYAGTDDRRSTTQLLVTFCVVLSGVGIVMSTAAWFLAPLIVALLHMSDIWRPQAVFLFRTLGILCTTLFLHTLFQYVLNARQRYAWSTFSSLLTYALYVVGFVIVIDAGLGLRGVAFIFVGQQVLASLLIVPVALRYLDRRAIALVPWAKLRSIMSFSGKQQIGGISGLVTSEVDSLVIGGGLSAHALGIYSPGANFANQLTSVAFNGLGPAGVHLGNVYGSEGEDGTFREFKRLQRLWVMAVTGWTMVAMASSYFGIVAWLGPKFSLAGWICIVLAGGSAIPLTTGLIGTFAVAVGKVGAMMRYGIVSMIVNIAFTIPMVLLGSLGVVAATAAGMLASAIYMMHDVRRSIRHDIPNPLRYVPLVRGVVVAVLTLGLELAVRPYLPQGPIGLLGAGVPALVGLGVFGVLVIGPRRALRMVADPHSAKAELRDWADLSQEPTAPAGPVPAEDASSGYQPKHSAVMVGTVPEASSISDVGKSG